MLKGLFVCEDSLLLDRIKTGFNELKQFEYLFASSSDEAVEFAKAGDIAICCISIKMDVLSGAELADIVIDENPEVRFIFIYDEADTESAIEMFNTYDGSRIILKDNFSVEMLKELFLEEVDLYDSENRLHNEAKAYREREKMYKESMAGMSNVLNQRVECYKSIVKMYTAGIEMVMPDFSRDESRLVKSFLEKEFSEYIDRFVVGCESTESFYESLSNDLNNSDEQKHYQILGKEGVPDGELGILVRYAIHFMSHAFCDFLEKYRFKVEIKESQNSLRVDFLSDTRLGNVRKGFLEEYLSILNDIVVTLCDKCERGSKDGIVQYRFYYQKETEFKEP